MSSRDFIDKRQLENMHLRFLASQARKRATSPPTRNEPAMQTGGEMASARSVKANAVAIVKMKKSEVRHQADLAWSRMDRVKQSKKKKASKMNTKKNIADVCAKIVEIAGIGAACAHLNSVIASPQTTRTVRAEAAEILKMLSRGREKASGHNAFSLDPAAERALERDFGITADDKQLASKAKKRWTEEEGVFAFDLLGCRQGGE